MAKFTDWGTAQDAKDIAERFLDRFPSIFEGFDTEGIFFIKTQKKKSRKPINMRSLGYPGYVLAGKPYVMEVFDVWWNEMDDRQKNIAVFDAMNSVPEGGFDEQSRYYGKILQPEIKMHMNTFAACGGVPNWYDNPSAKDPMNRTSQEMAQDAPVVDAIVDEPIARKPITMDDVAGVGAEEAA